MGIGQVGDVHEVADAAAVGGRIVLAVHGQRRSPEHRLERERNDVDFRGMVFAEET